VLLNFAPENLKNTYLGLLTFAGLVIAMVLQPISGDWSDGWRSRFGRRRPLMLVGTSFEFIFLAILGWSGGLIWLAVGYLGLQIASNLAHGAAQGLIPDNVPQPQPDVPAGKVSVLESLRSIHPAYRWLIASRFVFLLGIYDIQVFAQYYIRDVIKAPNPVALTGNLLAAITLALIAFALAGGWLDVMPQNKKLLWEKRYLKRKCYRTSFHKLATLASIRFLRETGLSVAYC
jgi:MFS family permease